MTNIPQAAPESEWAELRKILRELVEENRESAKRQAENERILTEKFVETDRQIKKVNETLGSWANHHGSFAETYFFNLILSLINGTATKTGLTVKAQLDENNYPTGIKISDEDFETINIKRNKFGQRYFVSFHLVHDKN